MYCTVKCYGIGTFIFIMYSFFLSYQQPGDTSGYIKGTVWTVLIDRTFSQFKIHCTF